MGLRLREVSKRYGARGVVLDRVSLDIGPGDVIGIRGANGSGKSTLLKVLVGLLTPTAGTVTGRPRRVGYVPERFPSHQRMPATSYLIHMGRIGGLPARRAHDRAGKLLRRLELVGGADTPLRQLSKGNAQKVAIAQALMVPPDLLVLDEPWSGLDESAHGTFGELLCDVTASGGAVVFTDHREAVIRRTATTVYHLVGGCLALARTSGAEDLDVVNVLLVAPGTSRPAGEVRWERVPGVLRAVPAGPDAVSLNVVVHDRDALLFTALRAGWSVERVGRVPAPDGVR